MSIDPHSHVPIFQQIVEHVCGGVAAGVFRPGDPLPSIRGLALELMVNPNTVQRAYQELERQGLIYTRKGVGAFVAEDGDASARLCSEQAVGSTFEQGIGIGRAAKLSTDRIEAIFRRAIDGAGGSAGRGKYTRRRARPSEEGGQP